MTIREHPPDVDDTSGAVDVASFEREPLLSPQPRQRGEHRDRPEHGGELDVDGRKVAIEARFVAADLAAGVLTFEPIVLDPVPGEPGIVDQDGRVDGRVLVLEEA